MTAIVSKRNQFNYNLIENSRNVNRFRSWIRNSKINKLRIKNSFSDRSRSRSKIIWSHDSFLCFVFWCGHPPGLRSFLLILWPLLHTFSNLFWTKKKMCAVISRSRFEAALIYKPRSLSLKNEEFPFLVLT